MSDPVSLLQPFAMRWNGVCISPSGRLNRSLLVEDAIRIFSQTFSMLGGSDPSLD